MNSFARDDRCGPSWSLSGSRRTRFALEDVRISVRADHQAELRVREAQKLGFRRCILPTASERRMVASDGCEIVGVESLDALWKVLF